MKDWLLSEIFEECGKHKDEKYPCRDCKCRYECAELGLEYVHVFLGDNSFEPRDMIKLPYKQKRLYHIPIYGSNEEVSKTMWKVIYRNETEGVDFEIFYTEEEADKFLEKLRGEK